jgi:toxin-antitoxin system PIN domain toxin
MLKSKTCLTDANVWVALAAQRHQHHAAASRWFLSLGEEQAVFCRITQMGFLRLLGNAKVMGEDALGPLDAWRCYQDLRRDWRVGFASEPAGIEQSWIECMRVTPRARSWTDAYLAAFAIGHGYTLVSFDLDFSRWQKLRFDPLPPARRLI